LSLHPPARPSVRPSVLPSVCRYTKLNPLVPSMFAAVTVVFIVVVVVARLTGREKAVALGRKVYAQYGRLERPVVLGDDEGEAILRGWLTPRVWSWMVLLQVGGWVS
jgi:hypothetical protein